MRIQDPGLKIFGSGIWDPGWKKFGSRIRDGKFGSGIWDLGSGINILRSAISLPNLLGLKKRIIIEPFVEKAFWDETKSFLESKAASVALKRGKTPGTGFFNLQQDMAALTELHPQGQNRYCSLPS